MSWGEGAIVVAAAVGTAFAAAASQPYTEETQVTPKAKADVACTVRLNLRKQGDPTPVDERYLSAHIKDSTDPSRLAGTGAMAGITYTQPGPLQHNHDYFRYTNKGPTPEPLDRAFDSYTHLNGRYGANNRYFELQNPSGYRLGEIYDASYENWNESYEVDLQDPTRCLMIKKTIQGHPPDYDSGFSFSSSMPQHTSLSFAQEVWKNTGKPSDPDKLKADPSVRFIDRETRLDQDRASGQLKSDYSDIPPPYRLTK